MPVDEKQLSRVTGFLVPIFSQALKSGQELHLLEPGDMQRVQEGYACGQCLASFDRFTLVCPLCKTWHETSATVEPVPQDWVDHLIERNREDPPEKVTPTVDTAIAAALGHSDVEHLTTTQLTKKVRKGH